MGRDPDKCTFSDIEIGKQFVYAGELYYKLALIYRKIPSATLWVSGRRPPSTLKPVNARGAKTSQYRLFAGNETVIMIRET